MNTGLLGGTFDPVHKGHMAVAETVMSRVGLDEVVFMPAARTPLKENIRISAAEHRIEMIRCAIEGIPYFRLSTIEMSRTGPSYTVDTLSELRKTINDEDELFLIIGCDSLINIHQWKEPERLLKMCRLVAVPRPGYTIPAPETLEKEVPGLSKNVIILDEPNVDISATDIRERVAQGLSIKHLVPEAVDQYIKKHKLYMTE
ncbi:nicotinate-nucleotide adenylyltransferase [Chloroflexota bacterium]